MNLLLIVWPIIFVGCAAKVLLELRTDQQLQEIGVITDAEVIEHIKGGIFRSRDVYSISYSFYAGMANVDRAYYYKIRRVNKSLYDSIQDSDPIKVIYLPSNPNVSELAVDVQQSDAKAKVESFE